MEELHLMNWAPAITQTPPPQDRLAMAQQEITNIGWAMRTVGVFLSMSPLQLTQVRFLPGMLVIRVAGMSKAEALQYLAEHYQTQIAADSVMDGAGVLIRVEENEL